MSSWRPARFERVGDLFVRLVWVARQRREQLLGTIGDLGVLILGRFFQAGLGPNAKFLDLLGGRLAILPHGVPELLDQLAQFVVDGRIDAGHDHQRNPRNLLGLRHDFQRQNAIQLRRVHAIDRRQALFIEGLPGEDLENDLLIGRGHPCLGELRPPESKDRCLSLGGRPERHVGAFHLCAGRWRDRRRFGRFVGRLAANSPHSADDHRRSDNDTSPRDADGVRRSGRRGRGNGRACIAGCFGQARQGRRAPVTLAFALVERQITERRIHAMGDRIRPVLAGRDLHRHGIGQFDVVEQEWLARRARQDRHAAAAQTRQP